MAELKTFFTNADTASQYDVVEEFNWNRIIEIPGKYKGMVSDIPPPIAELLITQGRKDLVKKLPQ